MFSIPKIHCLCMTRSACYLHASASIRRVGTKYHSPYSISEFECCLYPMTLCSPRLAFQLYVIFLSHQEKVFATDENLMVKTCRSLSLNLSELSLIWRLKTVLSSLHPIVQRSHNQGPFTQSTKNKLSSIQFIHCNESIFLGSIPGFNQMA